MREEVVKNRIRRQAEEIATADLNWKKAALRGQAIDAVSKREAATLQYYDGVKVRTFRTAKLRAASRAANAHANATAVPVHSQAGALLR